MKKYLLLFVGVISFIAVSCQTKVSENTIEVIVFKEQLNQVVKKQILDVRTPDEWSTGTIEGAIKINYFEDNFKAKLSQLDKSIPVYVYCRSGNRSGKAMKIMLNLGFQKVINLEGGMMAWESAKYPVVK